MKHALLVQFSWVCSKLDSWQMLLAGVWLTLLVCLEPTQLWAQYCPNSAIVAGGNGKGAAANQLNGPIGLAVDAQGSIYVADNYNHRIQRWVPGATQGSTVAGGNGPGAAASQLNSPIGITVDAQGSIYVADNYNHRIQRWVPGATQGTTVAGGNGPGATANQLTGPAGVALDAQGNLYIVDFSNHRIQRWAPGATQGTTVAGGNGPGSAVNQLYYPYGVALDGQGNIYVADLGNHRIQRWTPGATQGTTVAGGNGAGLASNQLYYPYGVALDAQNNIYVANLGNQSIQLWAPGATQGTTVAGGNGQGSASNQLFYPYGVALDAQNNIYISDHYNNRIQRFSTGPLITQQPPTSQRVCAGAPLAISVTTSGTITGYQWYRNGARLSGQTAATLTLTDVSPDNAGRYVLVVTGSCSLTTTAFDLTVNAAPILTINASTNTLCTAQTASLTASGASTYQWQGPGGFTSSANPITVSAPGTYSVTGTSAAGCTASVTTNLTAGSPPTPALTNDGPLSCIKPTVALTVNGAAGVPGSTIQFSKGATPIASSNQATVTTGGIYSVTVTAANGCSATAQTTVEVNTPLTAPALTAAALTSDNTPISVTASGCSGSLNWSAAGGSGTVNGTIYTFTQPGSYSLTARCMLGSCTSPVAHSLTLCIRPGSFAIRDVELIRCQLVDAARGQYQISLTPRYSGLSGLPLSFGVTNELASTTAPGPYSLRLYTDNPVITLVAMQGSTSVSYRYSWLASCPIKPTTPPATSRPPVVGTGLANQTAQVGQVYTLFIPSGTFSDPDNDALQLSVIGLPAGLNFSSTQHIITGTPAQACISSVLVMATDPGGLSTSTSFVLTIQPASTTITSAVFSIAGVTGVRCETLGAGERLLSFSPVYTGLTGEAIRFGVTNELVTTTAPGPYTLRMYTDNPAITLTAVQGGTAVSYRYNWLATCVSSPNGRQAVAEASRQLAVVVMGKPVTSESVTVVSSEK